MQLEIALYTVKCSHHLAYFCVVLTCSLGQMGVGHFTHKFEAAEPRAWAPFTHFNMNSYCSCLNSSTLSKLLRQKWKKKMIACFPPKCLCFETELLWFPVSFNVGSTGVSWSVCVFPTFLSVIRFLTGCWGNGGGNHGNYHESKTWAPHFFSNQPMQTYNQCEKYHDIKQTHRHDIKCAAVLCLISVLLLLAKHLN